MSHSTIVRVTTVLRGHCRSTFVVLCSASVAVVLSPDHTLDLCEGKGLETLERVLGRAHQHYITSIAHDGACYFRSWQVPKESKISLFMKLYH